MNKKYLIFGLLILLFSSFTSADLITGLQSYYRGSINNSYPDSIGSVTGTIDGATFFTNGFIDGDYGTFGSANNKITLSSNPINTSLAFTVGFWQLKNADATQGVLMMGQSGTNNMYFQSSATGKMRFNINSIVILEDATGIAGDFTNYNAIMVTHLGNGTYELFVNNISIEVDADAQVSAVNEWTILHTTDGIDINRTFNGNLDEIVFYNRVLSSADRAEWFNNGAGVNITLPVSVNESTESVVFDRQIGTVGLAGGGFDLVQSISFNTSVNDVPAYFSNLYEVTKSGSGTAVLECSVDVDSVNILNITRTVTASEFGNLYMVTPNISLANGTHTQELFCQRASGGGSITMSKGIMFGHAMVDNRNVTLNNEFFSFNLTNISDSFVLLDEFNFTTSNFTNGTSVISNVIVDWSANYEYTTTGNITTMLQIDGVNCSEFQIGASIGDLRVAGGICGIKNVTPNTESTIKIFGRDSGGLAFMNIFVKEILLESPEIIFGNGSLVGVNITSSSLTKLATLNIQNLDHLNVDLLGQIGIAVKSNSGSTTANFQIVINGTINDNTSVYQRTIDENGGVVVLQDIIEAAPVGTYDFNIFASCDNSDCTITGSDGAVYLTNIIEEVSNVFLVTANNSYNGSTILSFSVITAPLGPGARAIFTSNSTGTAGVFSARLFDNLTISSLGFISNEVILHDTTEDLQVSLFQALINIFANFKKDGSQILNFNATDGVIFGSTTNGSLILPFNSGNFNITINSLNFFPETEETTIVSLSTTNILNFSLGNTTIRVEGFNELTNVPITTFTGLFSSIEFPSFSQTISTTNGNITFNNFISNYTLLVTAPGFATTQFNFTQENVSQNFSFTLLPGNSINISVFNVSNLNLLTQDASVELISSTNTITTNFTGSEILTNVASGFYLIKVNSNSFDPRNYFVNITNTSSQSLNVFLLPSDLGDITTLTLITEALDPIEDGILSLLRLTNGTKIVVEQGLTDVVGEVRFNMESDVRYTILVEAPGFSTREVEIECCNVARAYTIVLGLDPTIIFDTSASGVSTLIRPENSVIINELQQFNFTVSAIGSLNFFGLFTDNFTGGRQISNITASPSGGMTSLTLNMTNLNISGSTFTITYFYEKDGLLEVLTVRNYFFSDIVINESNIIQTFRDIGDDIGVIGSAFIATAISVGVGVSFITIGASVMTGSIISIAMLGFFALLSWIDPLIYSFVAFASLLLWYLNGGTL